MSYFERILCSVTERIILVYQTTFSNSEKRTLCDTVSGTQWMSLPFSGELKQNNRGVRQEVKREARALMKKDAFFLRAGGMCCCPVLLPCAKTQQG